MSSKSPCCRFCRHWLPLHRVEFDTLVRSYDTNNYVPTKESYTSFFIISTVLLVLCFPTFYYTFLNRTILSLLLAQSTLSQLWYCNRNTVVIIRKKIPPTSPVHCRSTLVLLRKYCGHSIKKSLLLARSTVGQLWYCYKNTVVII